jgi:dUTP pyrophosphatase
MSKEHQQRIAKYYTVPQEVKLKRIDKSLPLPEYQTEGSVGFDIYARETTEIPGGKIVLVPSNLIIQTPPGYALLLIERSSLRKKVGLTLANNVGVIDQDYCGDTDEIMIALYNPNTPKDFVEEVLAETMGQGTVVVKRGQRIAQGLFMRVAKAHFVEQDETLGETRGGFGSTGEVVDRLLMTQETVDD